MRRVSPYVPQGDQLELSFRTAELREICERRAVAIDRLGSAAALELGKTLADMEAVETFAELALIGYSPYDEPPANKIIGLESGGNLLLASGDPQASNPPDWATTTRIKLLAIHRND
jgi:hypothetical protein